MRGSGGVEDPEEPLDERPDVGPVFAGAGVEELLEEALLPYAGVVGEQHEHEAHEEHLEVVSAVAGVLQRVVEATHLLGGLDVDFVFGLESARLVSGEEPEPLDVVGQLLQRELDRLVEFQVEDSEVGEVAGDHQSGLLDVAERVEVVQRLRFGVGEGLACGLVLDGDLAFPEGVDAASSAGGESGGLALVLDVPAADDAEHGEPVVPEGLRFGVLPCLAAPLRHETDGVLADLVPREWLGGRSS